MLATLPKKKRGELAKLCRTDSDKVRKPKALRSRAAARSDKIQELTENLRRKGLGGAVSSAVTSSAEEATLAPGVTPRSRGLIRPERADRTGEEREQDQQVLSGSATRGGTRRTKGQVTDACCYSD